MARINGSVTQNTAKYRFYVNVYLSQNQSANQTTITADMMLDSYYIRFQGNTSGHISIAGDSQSYSGQKNVGSTTPQWITTKLYSKTKTITHNADGSHPNVSISADFLATSGGYGPGSCEASGSISIPRIPRQSSFASIPTITPGKQAVVTISSPVSSWSHTLKLTLGSVSITKSMGAGVKTATFTSADTEKLYAAMAKNTAEATLTLTNSAGLSSTASATVSIDVSAASPVWSGTFSYQDITNAGITGDNQKIIAGISDIRITIPAGAASAQKSATLTKYIASCGSVTGSAAYSASGAVTITLKDVSAAQITVAAVDSRGNQRTVSKIAEVIQYTPPVIRTASARRVNGSTAEVILSLDGTIYTEPIGQTTNAVQSLVYTYTPDGGAESSPISIVPTVSNGRVSFSASIQGDLGTGGFTVQNSFTVKLTLTDKLTSTTLTIALNSGIVLMDLYRQGDVYGVGVGAMYDPAAGGRLQVDGEPIIESGTWTPRFINRATGAQYNVTADIIDAYYFKIGDLIYFSCVFFNINAFSAGSNNRAGISGLPFPVKETTSAYIGRQFNVFSLPELGISATVENNNISFYFTRDYTNAGYSGSDGGSLYVSGCYLRG